MLPVLRLLALAALRGQMTPKETQTFAVLTAAGLFGTFKVLKASTSGAKGLIKSLLFIATLHAVRKSAYKAVSLLFPATFAALGLPPEAEEENNGEIVPASDGKLMEHKFSLRLLQSCMELAIKLNYRGMEAMEIAWAFSLRDMQPNEAGITDVNCTTTTPDAPALLPAPATHSLENSTSKMLEPDVSAVSYGSEENGGNVSGCGFVLGMKSLRSPLTPLSDCDIMSHGVSSGNLVAKGYSRGINRSLARDLSADASFASTAGYIAADMRENARKGGEVRRVSAVSEIGGGSAL